MIIAFTGKAGSGKSAAAKFLQREHGFTIHKFAGPLKNMMRCLGLDEEHIEGVYKEAPLALLCGKSPRYAMQTIGTQWGRDIIGEDLWINAWLNTMPQGDVVVDDCRFENEYDAVKTLGGKVYQIVRDVDDLEIQHESENGLDGLPMNGLIFNDKGVATLEMQVWEILRA